MGVPFLFFFLKIKICCFDNQPRLGFALRNSSDVELGRGRLTGDGRLLFFPLPLPYFFSRFGANIRADPAFSGGAQGADWGAPFHSRLNHGFWGPGGRGPVIGCLGLSFFSGPGFGGTDPPLIF